MAAFDLFAMVTAGLSQAERSRSEDLIGRARTDLLEARSEEARVRIVHNVIRELHDRQRRPKAS